MKLQPCEVRKPRWPMLVPLFFGGALLHGCVIADNADLDRAPAAGLTSAPGPVQVADVGRSHVRISEPSLLDTPYGHYLAGRHAERSHDYGRAADLFSAALSAESDNKKLRRQAFSVLIRAGRIESAIPIAEAMFADDPDESSMVALVLAVNALKKNQYNEALRYLRTPARQGEQYSFPLMKAWAQLGAGDTDAALAALAQLREGDAFPDLAKGHSGLILSNSGDLEGAQAAIAISAEELDTAPAWLIRALARVRLSAGDAQGAADLLDEYVAGNRFSLEHIEADREELRGKGSLSPILTTPAAGAADGLLRISSGIRPRTVNPNIRQPAHDIALTYARLAVYMDDTHDEARLLVAGMLQALGRFDESSTVLAEIKNDAPFSWRARIARADNLIDQERDDEAVALLEEMAAERPNDIDSLLKIGDILRARARFEEGSELYDRAFSRISEDHPDRWRLHYFRGITYERSKRWPEAEADFLAALDARPENPYVLNYLGYSWIDQGINIERATEMVRRAVEQRQNDGYIVDSLGWAYYRVGRFEEAVVELEKAVQLRPSDPVINDHLGDAYWRVGREREARFQWTRALSLDIDEELIPEIEKKMDEGLGAFEEPGATSSDG